MSHPVHPFVKPFTCVAQTVWMGAGQRLRGRGGEGGGALSRQAVDATEWHWGDNAWGADAAGPARRAARAGWDGVGAMRTRCHL